MANTSRWRESHSVCSWILGLPYSEQRVLCRDPEFRNGEPRCGHMDTWPRISHSCFLSFDDSFSDQLATWATPKHFRICLLNSHNHRYQCAPLLRYAFFLLRFVHLISQAHVGGEVKTADADARCIVSPLAIHPPDFSLTTRFYSHLQQVKQPHCASAALLTSGESTRISRESTRSPQRPSSFLLFSIHLFQHCASPNRTRVV